MSEPFELRLLLSLKNDKNILSYSLLYRAFHNDCWQDAVPWLELSCTCFSLSQMQDILTSEPVPLVDSLLSTLIFYNNRINGQHLCLLLPCAWHIGFMRYSGDGGIFANLQLDLAFKIPVWSNAVCRAHFFLSLFFFLSLSWPLSLVMSMSYSSRMSLPYSCWLCTLILSCYALETFPNWSMKTTLSFSQAFSLFILNLSCAFEPFGRKALPV